MGSEIQVASTWGRGSCISFVLATVTIASLRGSTGAEGMVVGYKGLRKHLLIHDIDPNRAMMFEFWTSLGFDVTQTTNGLEARASAKTRIPDLVLTDERMPVMGGWI